MLYTKNIRDKRKDLDTHMVKAQINPKLVELLTHKERTAIPDSPTTSWLPGKYVMMIYKSKDQVNRNFPENHFMLTCKSCGRKGKYNVGIMLIDPNAEKIYKPLDIFVVNIVIMLEIGSCLKSFSCAQSLVC